MLCYTNNLEGTKVKPPIKITCLEYVCYKTVRELLDVDAQEIMHSVSKLKKRKFCTRLVIMLPHTLKKECDIHIVYYTGSKEYKADGEGSAYTVHSMTRLRNEETSLDRISSPLVLSNK